MNLYAARGRRDISAGLWIRRIPGFPLHLFNKVKSFELCTQIESRRACGGVAREIQLRHFDVVLKLIRPMAQGSPKRPASLMSEGSE